MRSFPSILVHSMTDSRERVDIWEEDDLTGELGLADPAAVRNALYFWNNAGVLRNVEEETWALLEEADKSAEAAVSHGTSRCIPSLLGGIGVEGLCDAQCWKWRPRRSRASIRSKSSR